MGYRRNLFRSLFAAIGVLLLSLVSASSSTLWTSVGPEVSVVPEVGVVLEVSVVSELQPIPDVFNESTFVVLPKEIGVNVSDTFVIGIFAGNLSDMYGWQICLNFDPEIVECVNVSVPISHVFSDRYPVSQALIDWNSTEFTDKPLQNINNNKGYVLAGDCLFGANQTTFSGSGFLVQLTLKAISPGSSYLALSLSEAYYDTYLIDSKLKITTPVLFDGTVIVTTT